jgi:hypothetical protein
VPEKAAGKTRIVDQKNRPTLCGAAKLRQETCTKDKKNPPTIFAANGEKGPGRNIIAGLPLH